MNRKLIGANLKLSTTGKHSVCTTPYLYDFVPCLSLGSVFCYWICVQWYPRLPGHKVGYSRMFFDKWKLRNRFFHYYRKKKRRDWQRMKQRCHRHCVFNVSCMIQMAAFQFSDGNSTLAFTAVCSLTLWAGYLHEAKLSQTTVSPNHWTSRILYNKSWWNWINVLLLLAFSPPNAVHKNVKVQMKGSAK